MEGPGGGHAAQAAQATNPNPAGMSTANMEAASQSMAHDGSTKAVVTRTAEATMKETESTPRAMDGTPSAYMKGVMGGNIGHVMGGNIGHAGHVTEASHAGPANEAPSREPTQAVTGSASAAKSKEDVDMGTAAVPSSMEGAVPERETEGTTPWTDATANGKDEAMGSEGIFVTDGGDGAGKDVVGNGMDQQDTDDAGATDDDDDDDDDVDGDEMMIVEEGDTQDEGVKDDDKDAERAGGTKPTKADTESGGVTDVVTVTTHAADSLPLKGTTMDDGDTTDDELGGSDAPAPPQGVAESGVQEALDAQKNGSPSTNGNSDPSNRDDTKPATTAVPTTTQDPPAPKDSSPDIESRRQLTPGTQPSQTISESHGLVQQSVSVPQEQPHPPSQPPHFQQPALVPASEPSPLQPPHADHNQSYSLQAIPQPAVVPPSSAPGPVPANTIPPHHVSKTAITQSHLSPANAGIDHGCPSMSQPPGPVLQPPTGDIARPVYTPSPPQAGTTEKQTQRTVNKAGVHMARGPHAGASKKRSQAQAFPESDPNGTRDCGRTKRLRKGGQAKAIGSIYAGGSKHFFNEPLAQRNATVQDVPNHYMRAKDIPALGYLDEPTLAELFKDVPISTDRVARTTELVVLARERLRVIYEAECQWKKEFDNISKGLLRCGGKCEKIKEIHKETCALMDEARDKTDVYLKQIRSILESCPKIDEHRHRVLEIVGGVESP